MQELLSSPEVWLSFATLAALEVVLGVDNIIFIAILSGRLPVEQRERARKLGLAGAFRLPARAPRDVVVDRAARQAMVRRRRHAVLGKIAHPSRGRRVLALQGDEEIHDKLESADGETERAAQLSFRAVFIQIVLLDMVFSIDSVITAVGMTPHITVMIAANVVALVVMLAVGRPISAFVERHPSVKVLALSFLLMIGLVLVAEAFGVHVPKGYIYGAMGFSVFVELVNIRATRKPRPVRLNQTPRVAEIQD